MANDDLEALKWFWQNTSSSFHRDEIIEGVVSKGDGATFKWFWQNVTSSFYRDKILEGVVSRGDGATLKWFWQNVTSSFYRDKILEEVVSRGDGATLKWFWQNVTSSFYRDKIIHAMGINSVNRNAKIIKKFKKTADSIGSDNLNESYEYDVFISHASEDKETFVRELAARLSDEGVRVWFDEFTLSLGDNLRRSIDYGLTSSRYGVVVFSDNFFKKEWPQKELDGLVARENGLDKIILPIWHGVVKEDVQSFSPILANRLAVSSNRGMDHVVNEIIKVLT